VEDGGNRWTKPFVGTLSLHAMFELRSFLLNGVILLDTPAATVLDVVDAIVQELATLSHLNGEQRDKVIRYYDNLEIQRGLLK